MKRHLAVITLSSFVALPAFAGEFLWGLDNTSTASLKKIDLATGVVVASVNPSAPPSSLSIQGAVGVGLSVINGRNVVLVSNPADKKVIAFDRGSGVFVGGYSTANLTGAFASGIGWNGGSKNLLVDAANDQLVVVDSEASVTNGAAVAVSNVLKVGQGFAGFDIRGEATGLAAGHRFFVAGAASAQAFNAPPGPALHGLCEVELRGQILSQVRLIQRLPAINFSGTLFGTGSDEITSRSGVGAHRGRLVVDDLAENSRLLQLNLNGEAVATIYNPAGALAAASESFLDGVDASYRYMVPSVAKAAGIGGSFFVSDLTISNLSAGAATVTIEFLEHDKDNSSSPPSATLSLGPGEGKVLTDVLGNSFTQTSNFGALRITSNAPLNAACNTYLTGNPAGQFGQSLPATDLGATPAGSTLELVQLDQNPTTKRSNLVVANPGKATLSVRIDFLDSAGVVLGGITRDIPASSMVQLSEAFKSIGLDNVSNGRIQVTAQGNGAFAIAAYVIDRGTNDPFAVVARAVSP